MDGCFLFAYKQTIMKRDSVVVVAVVCKLFPLFSSSVSIKLFQRKKKSSPRVALIVVACLRDATAV